MGAEAVDCDWGISENLHIGAKSLEKTLFSF